MKAKVWLWLHTTLDHYLCYDTHKCKDLVLFVASCKIMKTPVKGQTLEKPKLAEL